MDEGENKRQSENSQNENLGILDGDLDAVLTFCYTLSRFKEEKENAQPSTEQQVRLFHGPCLHPCYYFLTPDKPETDRSDPSQAHQTRRIHRNAREIPKFLKNEK